LPTQCKSSAPRVGCVLPCFILSFLSNLVGTRKMMKGVVKCRCKFECSRILNQFYWACFHDRYRFGQKMERKSRMKRFNGAVVLETDHGTKIPTRRVSLMCLDEVCDRVATVSPVFLSKNKKGVYRLTNKKK
jgi:hypothetical protein